MSGVTDELIYLLQKQLIAASINFIRMRCSRSILNQPEIKFDGEAIFERRGVGVTR